MSPAGRPTIDCDLHHPVLSVKDVIQATKFYQEKLGFSEGFTWGDPPQIAGVNLGNVSVHLVNGEPAVDAMGAHFVVGDADELFQFHKEQGVDIVEEPEDQVWGMRTYRIRDLDGYILGFGHYIYNTGPKIKVERVPVPVRMEKRLAGLLQDLAIHKRMSVDSCLEEMLLHSFEEVGAGVASPHSRSTLRYIGALKRKHGIDYDCHASYNFEE